MNNHVKQPDHSSISSAPSTPTMSSPSIARKDVPLSGGDYRARLRWRSADIAVGAAVGAASGVISWAFDFVTGWLFPIMTALLPGAAGLLHAVWYFPAVFAMLVIRKPGSAVYVSVIGVVFQILLGNQYGSVLIFVSSILQGLMVEIAFGLFGYRRWTLPVAVLGGALIAVEYNFWLLAFYYAGVSFFSPRGIIGTICEVIGGVLIAGVMSWFLYVAIAKTGALDRFASGRAVRRVA